MKLCSLLLAIFCSSGLVASAATFTVTTTNHTGAGSLRQAILDANASAGADIIDFNIPGGSGRTIIPTNALPFITDPVTIDGTTQPGYSNAPIVELNGQSAGNLVDGLHIATNNCIVRGLLINRFNGDGIEINGGGSNAVEGCVIGLDSTGTDRGNNRSGIFITNSAFNVIGGTSAAQRNVISGNNTDGVAIHGLSSTNNSVLGNIIGLGRNGNATLGNSQNGVYVNGAPGNVIGGSVAGARNVISFNSTGVRLEGTNAFGNVVAGNFIGLDITGTTNRGNTFGTYLLNAPSNTVGGMTTAERNVISCNSSANVRIDNVSARGNRILGNFIGTDVSGTGGFGNISWDGVMIQNGARDNVIGGVATGSANLIAFNNDGVAISTGTNNAVRGNSIFSNNDLGIDIGGNGVTPNDVNDVDVGANNVQNFPLLSSATNSAANVTIAGTLNSRPSTTYTLDFFANVAFEPTGHGEGQTYLGSTDVATDGAGNTSFAIILPTTLTGRYVTATATDPFGNTSEFSQSIAAASTMASTNFTVINTNDSGPGSLRQAILDANAFVGNGADTIAFNIPGAGPHTNRPSSALPVISDSVVIDGFTEPGSSTNSFTNGNNAVWQIVLDGASAGSGTDGLLIFASNCVVRGLNIIRFNNDGIEIATNGNSRVEGCLIGLGLDGSDQGNGGSGVNVVSSPNNVIGGSSVAQRNILSGNNTHGLAISGTNAFNTRVLFNFIGTGPQGTNDVGNSQDGININGAPSTVIGEMSSYVPNVIAGNNGDGVELNGAATTGTTVLLNSIGTDLTGTLALGNSQIGVNVGNNARSNVVGSVGAENLIAFNGNIGVGIGSGTNNPVRGNLIYSNVNLGLDLGNNGETANDAGDGDNGANGLQNFPFVTNAVLRDFVTEIQGTLNSRSNTTYHLDFYANQFNESSGNGEGQIYLGSTDVTTGADSNAIFGVVIPFPVQARFITATATDPFGNTSEFGPNFRALSAQTPLTLTVTNTNNIGAGSLRDAIERVNGRPVDTPHRIEFNIPGAGPHVISPSPALPAFLEPVIINGFTQPGASANTLANGNNAVWKVVLDGISAGGNADGLRFEVNDSAVRGLAITRFSSDGIEIVTNLDCVVEGCLIGLNVDGTLAGNGQHGVHVRESSASIGSPYPDGRNVISGNSQHGIFVTGLGAVVNRIAGNFIGTGLAGTNDFGNSGDGIQLNNAQGTEIGGAASGARNVISGNSSDGVELTGTTASTIMLGNAIGTDFAEVRNLGNSGNGVNVSGSSPRNSIIGVPTGGEGNVIAFNGDRGIAIPSTSTNHALRGNRFFSNNNLGIDLGSFGVTANDVGDGDSGANGLQNFPVLTNAVLNVGSTLMQGTLNSRPNATYTIDFYANTARDSSGHGEGQFYMGTTVVNTDAGGNASFSFTYLRTADGRFITATATDTNGNTSEFAASIRATSFLPPQTFTVINTNDFGPGSLRQAMLDNNASFNGAPNTIAFNIPGTAPHVIAPTNGYPNITEPVIIDGSTQPGSVANTSSNAFNAVLPVRIDGTNTQFTGGSGLTIATSNCVVRGLAITGFRSFPGSGVMLLSATNCVVEGCIIGLDTDGVNANANNLGVRIENSSGNRIGGTNAAQRNLIGGNSGAGIEVISGTPERNVVQGNILGLDRFGLARKPNSRGIWLLDGMSNVIGGTVAGARNVVSGNLGSGIQVGGSARRTFIVGNWIGPDVNGNAGVSNLTWALDIFGGHETQVGGVAPGEANVIAFNGNGGIAVSQNGTNNVIRGNSIRNNTGLGIELAPSSFADGPTPNDPGDADTGGNFVQNFPVITNAFGSIGSVLIQGTFNSQPTRSYMLDFYANQAADSSGFGEGQQYLGSTNVTTDGSGNANFSVTLPVTIVGRHLAATATDPDGNTSEFSQSFPAAVTFAPTTFTVVNTGDSGAGSLRQAILDSNISASSNRNTIAFNIPGAGPHIIAPAIALPPIIEPVIVDGYTQPGSAVNISSNAFNAVINVRLDGAGLFTDGLLMGGHSSSVRGLAFTRWLSGVVISNSNNTVEGCISGMDPSGVIRSNSASGVRVIAGGGSVIGGTTPSARNVISGNQQNGVTLEFGSSNTVILGNLLGTDFAGSGDAGNRFEGVFVGNSRGNVIGGTTPGSRNVISGNDQRGVSLTGGVSNRVEGNFIGLNAAATGALPNSNTGVDVQNTSFNLIARNVISRNAFHGVSVFNSQSNRIVGNFIGTDASGALPAGNTGSGIAVTTDNTIIGGVIAGEANRIAFNASRGVEISFGTNNALRGNEMFSNTNLGIDLGFFGVTTNDPGDADTGPNTLQNFPLITAATLHTNSTTVSGTLNSRANTTYAFDFFANSTCDISGNGEGQQYLGSTNVTTDGSGNVSLDVTLPTRGIGRQITATATDPTGNTSEFSPCFNAGSTIPPLTFVVTTDEDSGPGSLRQTLLDASAFPAGGKHVIQFNIPGPGPHTILLRSPLASPTESVTIDGFTQPGSSANTASNADNAVRRVRLHGTFTGFGTHGLRLGQPGNVVRGLEIRGFGGSGLDLESSANVIEGCLLTENDAHGVLVIGAGNRIGGAALAARNTISGNSQRGVAISTVAASSNLVQGNFIGVDASGTGTLSNAAGGVQISAAAFNVIGGAAQTGGNYISGNQFTGVEITGAGSISNRVEGNFIGVRPDDSPAPNTGGGVVIQGSASWNAVGVPRGSPGGGGSLPTRAKASGISGVQNLIANNSSDGVRVSGTGSTNNSIRANRIFNNQSQGIDLDPNGNNANDANDVDTGSNQRQNFPIITAVTILPNNTVVVSGVLTSAPSTSFQIDIYSSIRCDTLGLNGEGEYWRGSGFVTTDSSGVGNFSFSVNQPGIGNVITATATDPFGNTGEFSPCFNGTPGGPPIAPMVVTTTNDSGPGSLREKIEQANASASSNQVSITFNIPGPGRKVIQLESALPPILVSVSIDATTQAATAPKSAKSAHREAPLIVERRQLIFQTDWFNITANNSEMNGFGFQGVPGTVITAGSPNAPLDGLQFNIEFIEGTGTQADGSGNAAINAFANNSFFNIKLFEGLNTGGINVVGNGNVVNVDNVLGAGGPVLAAQGNNVTYDIQNFDGVRFPFLAVRSGSSSTPFIPRGACIGNNLFVDVDVLGGPPNGSGNLTFIYNSLLDPQSGQQGPTVPIAFDGQGRHFQTHVLIPPPNTVGVSAWSEIGGNFSGTDRPREIQLWNPFSGQGTTANFPLSGHSLHPVNLFSGELFELFAPDFNLGGPFPLVFQRFYGSLVSLGPLRSALGSNWLHNFDAFLSNKTTTVEIGIFPGMFLVFTNSGGNYSPVNRTDTPFQLRLIPGTFDLVLTDPRDERTYRFDAAGRLFRIEDGRGNVHTLVHTVGPTSSTLTSVSDGLGRTLTFSYNGSGALTNVSDGTRNVAFNQTGGLLTSSATPLGHATLNTYTNGTNQALLVAAQSPAGNVPFAQAYTNGVVISQSEGGAAPTRLNYVGNVTTMVDPLGANTQDEHDTNGLLRGFTDAAGNSITLDYDVQGRRTGVTDRMGRTTRLAYHTGSGRLAALTNADGSVMQFGFTNRVNNGATFHEVSQITYPDGTTERFTYDTNGNVITFADRANNVTRFVYNAQSQLLNVTNPLGGVLTFTYDAQGRRITSRDSETGISIVAYDQFSRPTNIVNPDGTSRRLTWDFDDRLMSATDERGHTTRFVYDANGRLTQVIDAAGNTNSSSYDAANRLVRSIDRLGNRRGFAFNARGEITNVTNENNFVWTFIHDARRRLTTVRDPGARSWQLGYDNEALLTTTSNPLGQQTSFARDLLGYLAGTTNPLGQAQQFLLDVMRRATNVIDEIGRGFAFRYDSRGSLTNTAHPGVGAAGFAYDALGNLTRITDLNGRAWSFSNSPNGRLVSMTDPLGRTTSVVYDTRGRLLRVGYPDGTGGTNTYDGAGNFTRVQYGGGPDLQFAYNALNRLTNANGVALAYDAEGRLTNNTSGGLNFSATYDAGGRLTSVSYSNGAFTVNYTYDSSDRLINVSDSFGTFYNFNYDNANRITQISRSSGELTLYTYDAAGRLVRIQSGNVLDLRYTLNAAGEVTAADHIAPIDPDDFQNASTVDFTYDLAHQINTPGHQYDARGRQTVSPGGIRSWDGATRLINVGGASYTYDGLGNLLTRTEGGATKRYFYHQALGGSPIALERDDSPGTTTRFYVWTPGGTLLYSVEPGTPLPAVRHYHFDRVGTTLALTDNGGNLTDAYAWTLYGELLARTGTSAQPFTYVGRFGVRQDGALFHMRARWYDPVSARFLTPDPVWPRLTRALELNPYQYAAEMPLEFVDPSGLTATTLPELNMQIAIIGVLMAKLLPAIQQSREAAQRMQAGNNLKQIGLALHKIHENESPLPRDRVYYNYSWYAQLLPYLEQDNLFRGTAGGNEAWPTGPATVTRGTFFAGGAEAWNSRAPMTRAPRTQLFIQEGASNTILPGERPANQGGSMTFWAGGNEAWDSSGFWNRHPAGTQFLFGDGNVRTSPVVPEGLQSPLIRGSRLFLPNIGAQPEPPVDFSDL